MSALNPKCGYAPPGTFGHECGRPAVFAGAQPSERTKSGTYWAARCAGCRALSGGDNASITRWELFDLSKHVNQWKVGA